MCSCSSNYFGSSCQYYNECSTSPCINNGTCIVNINTVTVHQYTCTCTEGWSGSECHIPVCTSYTCSNGGTCTVSGTTLVCTCTELRTVVSQGRNLFGSQAINEQDLESEKELTRPGFERVWVQQ